MQLGFYLASVGDVRCVIHNTPTPIHETTIRPKAFVRLAFRFRSAADVRSGLATSPAWLFGVITPGAMNITVQKSAHKTMKANNTGRFIQHRLRHPLSLQALSS